MPIGINLSSSANDEANDLWHFCSDNRLSEILLWQFIYAV